MNHQEKSVLRKKLWFYFAHPELLGMFLDLREPPKSGGAPAVPGPLDAELLKCAGPRNREFLEIAGSVFEWLGEERYFLRFMDECTEKRAGAVLTGRKLRKRFEEWDELRHIPYIRPKAFIGWLNERSGLPESNRKWKGLALLPPGSCKPGSSSTSALATASQSRWLGPFTDNERAFILSEIDASRRRNRRHEIPLSWDPPSQAPDALKRLESKEDLERKLSSLTDGKLNNFGNLVVLDGVLINGMSSADAISAARNKGYGPSWPTLSDDNIRSFKTDLKANGKVMGDTFVLVEHWCRGESVVRAIARVRRRGFKTHSKNWGGFKADSIQMRFLASETNHE